jgi:hypothetical protein
MNLRVLVRNLLAFIKAHPLVGVSLLVGVIEAPIGFYSGIFVGKDCYLIGGFLYCISTMLWIVSTLIYYKLILKE